MIVTCATSPPLLMGNKQIPLGCNTYQIRLYLALQTNTCRFAYKNDTISLNVLCFCQWSENLSFGLKNNNNTGLRIKSMEDPNSLYIHDPDLCVRPAVWRHHRAPEAADGQKRRRWRTWWTSGWTWTPSLTPSAASRRSAPAWVGCSSRWRTAWRTGRRWRAERSSSSPSFRTTCRLSTETSSESAAPGKLRLVVPPDYTQMCTDFK